MKNVKPKTREEKKNIRNQTPQKKSVCRLHRQVHSRMYLLAISAEYQRKLHEYVETFERDLRFYFVYHLFVHCYYPSHHI